MAYINLPKELPGIRGPMAFRPETAKPLNELAEVLLRSENSLSRGERELIATYVSSLNDCFFCQNAHGGIAQYYLKCDMAFIDQVKRDYESTPISDKLKALLSIAASVQKGGRQVTFDQIEKDYESTPISDKLKALLSIAASVQKGGRQVTFDQIEKAKGLGATDLEIHDTVLIAAAFCMFNRYVDGLGTWAPQDREFYTKRGEQRAKEGYLHFDLYK